MPTVTKLNLPPTLSRTVKKIINTRHYDKNNKLISGIPTLETLDDVYSTALPGRTISFDSFLNALHTKANANLNDANIYLASVPEPTISASTDSAFNNCNGKWTEYGVAAYAWNCLAKLNRDARASANSAAYSVYVYVKLPNRNSADNDWTQLLLSNITSVLSAYPARQSSRITDTTNSNYGRLFELISSNPDSVILKFDNTDALAIWQAKNITGIDLYTDITKLDVNTTTKLDSLFDAFKGQVLPSKNLQCFLSIKRSTRPDRRYQWVHEGDHIKTILQWIQVYSSTATPPLDSLRYEDLNGKFFAVSLSKISDADKDALNTGLVGSIVSPMLEPVWAVDKLMECRTFTDVATRIKEMIDF